jgi:hypothetical protein
MTSMQGLLSARSVATLVSLALVIVGCTAGTDTTYLNAGFQDPPPPNALQDGLTGTPQSGDPAPIVQGLTLPTTSQQAGQQGNGGGSTPSFKDGG